MNEEVNNALSSIEFYISLMMASGCTDGKWNEGYHCAVDEISGIIQEVRKEYENGDQF